jgi:Spy/CpxP family protein refolding chaperone
MIVVAACSPTDDALAQAPKTQDHSKHAQHADAKSAPADAPLAEQIRQLRAKVATLEAALAQGHRGGGPAAVGGPTPGMGMGKMGGGQAMGGGMGMMGGKGAGQGMGMMGGGMGMMEGMDMGMMGMGAMGQAPGMAGMTTDSALPGFPGASHLYHVGATGFFLDHGEHTTLTDPQKAELNRIKEQSLLEGATARRKIQEAEQALWALTAADQPDAGAIEANVSEIEKLRAGQRLAAIRAVGSAARVLTDEQRRQLVGAAATGPAHTSSVPRP